MKKINQEKEYISRMVTLHCKWGSGQNELCSPCEELIEYIYEQIDHCPYGSQKRLCRSCHTSCFSDDMKQRFNSARDNTKLRLILSNPFMMLKMRLIDIKDDRK